jgi:hypothetical protein
VGGGGGVVVGGGDGLGGGDDSDGGGGGVRECGVGSDHSVCVVVALCTVAPRPASTSCTHAKGDG